MGVATGCGCKEVYRFPHSTYPYSSCICSFLQQHPTFCSFKKKIIYIYIYSEIIVSTRWGSLSLAPIIYIAKFRAIERTKKLARSQLCSFITD